jgi:CHAD domain-containing protein/CYTH domain-containing protein
MHVDRAMLRDSARRTARRIAQDLLSKAREAQGKLDAGDDPEALHDFRVALRRLRSWLRAFEDTLADTVSPKYRRRLGDVADATGESRDLEVHIEWVTRFGRRQSKRNRTGVDWLCADLQTRKRRSDLALRRAIDAGFLPNATAVGERLDSFTSSVDEMETPFARAAAKLIRSQSAEARGALGAIGSIGDEAEAHAARIAAKRLRYLLEPLTECLDDAPRIVKQLSTLQDNLGKLHDAQVFGRDIARALAKQEGKQRKPSKGGKRDARVPGLHAMAHRLALDEKQAYASVERRWLSARSSPFWSAVESVAVSLEDIAVEGREIERKYLLRSLPKDAPPATVVSIDQGYMPGEKLVERVRRERVDGRAIYYRTVKVGEGLTRTELEEETTRPVFEALWPLTKGQRIRKRRHRIESDGHCWEIDEFLGRRLFLAEVELDDPSESVALPDWLEPVVTRDVTDDEAYGNRKLAR